MNPIDWTTQTWSAVASAATALAFIVSACVLWLQVKDRRRHDAEAVAVWVHDRYVPDKDGSLTRVTSVHLKNAGARPVFDAQVDVGFGHFGRETQRLGPLATPTQPVLAPGADETWSIEDLLASVELHGQLRAEVSFHDATGRWWTRTFEGRVKRWHRRFGRTLQAVSDDAINLENFGPMTWENPIAVAAAFFSLLGNRQAPERLSQLRGLCRPESVSDWGNFEDAARGMEGHGIAQFPRYPAPGIAYVTFPSNVEETLVATTATLIPASIMTLQMRRDLDPPGWRVFAVGSPIPPERVPPPGWSPRD